MQVLLSMFPRVLVCRVSYRLPDPVSGLEAAALYRVSWTDSPTRKPMYQMGERELVQQFVTGAFSVK
jgi:hypothetical protein